MTKQELLKELNSRTGVHRNAIEHVMIALADVVSEELGSGGEVILTGIGKLSTQIRAARMGVNPATGEPMDFPEKRVPKIQFAGTLKAAVLA